LVRAIALLHCGALSAFSAAGFVAVIFDVDHTNGVALLVAEIRRTPVSFTRQEAVIASRGDTVNQRPLGLWFCRKISAAKRVSTRRVSARMVVFWVYTWVTRPALYVQN
jgi:hypothetical protein